MDTYTLPCRVGTPPRFPCVSLPLPWRPIGTRKRGRGRRMGRPGTKTSAWPAIFECRLEGKGKHLPWFRQPYVILDLQVKRGGEPQKKKKTLPLLTGSLHFLYHCCLMYLHTRCTFVPLVLASGYLPCTVTQCDTSCDLAVTTYNATAIPFPHFHDALKKPQNTIIFKVLGVEKRHWNILYYVSVL